MPSTDDLQAQLATAQTELDELRTDLPQLEALLEKHEATERGMISAARLDPSRLDDLSEARRRREAVASMVSQHREDVTLAEAQVQLLERDLEQADLVAQIQGAYAEIAYATPVWAEEARAVVNDFVIAATQLGAERRRLKALHHEARELRSRLTAGLSPRRWLRGCAT